jgi:anti-sigma regulatory factor (Ser/Thr protein kinase)
MKKLIIVKMAAIIFLTNTASAALTENIKDYSAKVREASQSFSKLAKEAKGNKDNVLNSRAFKEIAAQFNVSSKDQARIAQAVVDGKTNIVTALYASMAAKELIKNNQIENTDMDQGLLGIIKVASVSGKGAATDANLKMTADEMSDASTALRKKTEYSIDMLSWNKDDAETHTAVMKKTAEIYESLKITPEEALVLAIMEVKGVDKEAAMKIIRKLKDCV